MAERHGGVDFFVSYTGADRAWAEWIAWQLEAADYSCVLQAWDFRPGENFVVQMRRALDTAERTLAVVSARGVPETGQWSCCAFVFVDQAAEEIAAVDLFGGWRSGYGLAR